MSEAEATAPINLIVDSLPTDNLTTGLLGVLDYVVPGEWENVTSWNTMIQRVTGEDDDEIITRVSARAIQLYNDPEQGYQRALQVFRLVDTAQTVLGAATFAQKLGTSFDFLSFLSAVTPKASTSQALDAGVKFAAELGTFCLCNGLPGDTIADFAEALHQYEKEDSMRFAAWIAFDLVLPFGPDFIDKMMDVLASTTGSDASGNDRFARIAQYLPGDDDDQKMALVKANVESSLDHMSTFVEDNGLAQDDLFNRIKGYVDCADNALDYVSAVIDMQTNYFQHTGIQSVSRRLISRAYGEI